MKRSLALPKISRELTKLFKKIDNTLFSWGPHGILCVKGTKVKVADVLRGLDTGLEENVEEKIRLAIGGFLDRPLKEKRRKRPLYVVDWGLLEEVIEEKKPLDIWVSLEGKWNEKRYLVYENGVCLFPEKYCLGSTKKRVEGLVDGHLFPCGVKGTNPTRMWRN